MLKNTSEHPYVISWWNVMQVKLSDIYRNEHIYAMPCDCKIAPGTIFKRITFHKKTKTIDKNLTKVYNKYIKGD